MAQLTDAFLDKLAEHGPIGKTLGMLIRPAFIAPEGKVLVWGDWSAIEARVLPWLADSPGARKQLDIFRASDADPTKPDIYIANAAAFVGRDPQELWDRFREGDTEAKSLRQSHGKVPVLSLGFGGGLGALLKMAINYGVHFTEEQGRDMVSGWRGNNPWAPEFWGAFRTDRHSGEVVQSSGLWGAANMAIRNPGEVYGAGKVQYVFEPDYLDGTLFCLLPCGRPLAYPSCRYRERTVKDKDTGEEETVYGLWYRKGYGWSTLWYGKLAENITQATAGSILRETLVSLDRAGGDAFPIVGHTHDEIVLEAPEGPPALEARAMLWEHMREPTEWREDLPLAVEVTDYPYYTKAA